MKGVGGKKWFVFRSENKKRARGLFKIKRDKRIEFFMKKRVKIPKYIHLEPSNHLFFLYYMEKIYIFLKYILPGFSIQANVRTIQSELFKYILMFSFSTITKMSGKIN